MLRSKIMLILAAVVAIIGWSAAQAEGSIGLGEVMEQLKDNGALIAELDAELKKQHLEAKDVACIGSRFGHHWTHLGGARSIPFECEIGARKIEIDGELQLYDKGTARSSTSKGPTRPRRPSATRRPICNGAGIDLRRPCPSFFERLFA